MFSSSQWSSDSTGRRARGSVASCASGRSVARRVSSGRRGFRVLVFSTGEKSVAEFLGKKDDAEGRRRRLVDIPAEVQPGSAFETIPPHQVDAAAAKFYPAADRLHGAVGEAWQRHLVNL